MVEEPMKPETLKIAEEYALLFPDSLDINLNKKNSKPAGKIAEFNKEAINSQKKY